jgi:hypothetical protein
MASEPTFKNLDTLVEQPESGALNVTDRYVLTKIYRARLSVCRANVPANGTIGTGETLGYSVDSANLTPEGHGIGKLTIQWVAGFGTDESGLTLPADKFDVQPVEQSPRIERHPMFKDLEDLSVEGESVLDIIYAITIATNKATRDAQITKLNSLTTPQKTLALKLVAKIRRGFESYYWAGLRYTWILYSWTVPDIEIGGYVQSPGGPLTGYFHPDFRFLREADSLSDSDGVYQLTRSWFGVKAGVLDEEIYAAP